LPLQTRIAIRKRIFHNAPQVFLGKHSIDLSEFPDVPLTQEKLRTAWSNRKVIWANQEFEMKHAEYSFPINELNTGSKITFDIWDTLIGRNRPAEGVKASTSLFISLYDWQQRSFAGNRYSVEALYLLRNEIESKIVRNRGEANLLDTLIEIQNSAPLNFEPFQALEFEILGEIKHTYPILSTLEMFSTYRNNSEFVSDFHLSSSALNRILAANSIFVDPKRIFCSSDLLKTKRNGGELFSFLGFSKLDSWTHVGDNPLSDVKYAKALGANTIQISKSSLNSWHGHELDIKELAIDLPDLITTHDSNKYLASLSVIAYALCTSAIEQALSKGLRKVVYISREGETLKLCHDALINCGLIASLPRVESFWFKVSRSSIVMASWATNESLGLNEISKQYPIMNRDALIKTLGIPSQLHYLVERNFGKFEKFRTSNSWDRLDLEARSSISTYLVEQNQFIRRFLLENEILPEQIIICDLGWRGSIQESMERIIGSEYTGQYLGLLKSYSSSGSKLTKKGLLFDEYRSQNLGFDFSFFGPLERAFTISARQTSRYADIKGVISPVEEDGLEYLPQERVDFTHSMLPKSLDIVAEQLMGIGLFGTETREFAEKILENWMTQPNSYQASVWFDEIHGEGFGAGDQVHYSKFDGLSNWINKPLRLMLNENSVNAIWVEGFLNWKPIRNLKELCIESK
jgi:FMN phosphatase YigB (HAD superfamily)